MAARVFLAFQRVFLGVFKLSAHNEIEYKRKKIFVLLMQKFINEVLLCILLPRVI